MSIPGPAIYGDAMFGTTVLGKRRFKIEDLLARGTETLADLHGIAHRCHGGLDLFFPIAAAQKWFALPGNGRAEADAKSLVT